MHRSNRKVSGRLHDLSVWVIAGTLALMGSIWTGIARAEAVECFVYDDGYSNMAGPSDAVYFAGPNKACIPDNTATGTCRKWFGRCRSKETKRPVSLRVFNNGYTSLASGRDSVYVPSPEKACLPDDTASGNCRRWFGFSDNVTCRLFNDGYSSQTNAVDAVYFRTGGQVCGPDGSSQGICRKWFGRCTIDEAAKPQTQGSKPSSSNNGGGGSAASWYDVGCGCSFGATGQKKLCFLNSSDSYTQAAGVCDLFCRVAYEQLGLVGPASSLVRTLQGPQGGCTQDFANSVF